MSILRILLMFFMLFLLLGAIGFVIGLLVGNGLLWLELFLILAFIINVFSVLFSYKLVLWSYHAKEIREEENPRLFALVRDVSQNASIPMPRIAIAPIDTPNAFATGISKKKAFIVFTSGILSLLNEKELRGVIGHELGHIKHKDILVVTTAATIASALMIGSRIFEFRAFFDSRRSGQDLVVMLLLILAATGAMMLQLAISRQRELYADEHGAKVNNSSSGLISALQKLENWNVRKPIQNSNPATASLFIVNPLGKINVRRLFSTHPPMEERIERLRNLGI
ncbi:MAG: M48 family metalloprotease [Candidatus Thermoplasmatota archaeon]|nr:M48 family metalloprotease [Candidatus Thermoplasmatota archaeon]